MRLSITLLLIPLWISLPSALRAQASDSSQLEQDAIKVVNAWDAAWATKDAEKVAAYMADDCEFRADPKETELKKGRAEFVNSMKRLIGAGITDPSDAILGPSLRFLRNHVFEHLLGSDNYYWYGEYYAAQALFHSPDPADWDAYWAKAWPTIAKAQENDGLWTRSDNVGPAYNSAMALIILQIPNNYLPIFQR